MPIIAVIECNHCAGLLLAPAEQKTRTCPYCGTRIELPRAKRVATAQSAQEASEILRAIKSTRQTNPRRTHRG
ncbi:MAG: DUF1922 domain-containing protein [Candidatus Bathyarchaeia archaeon]